MQNKGKSGANIWDTFQFWDESVFIDLSVGISASIVFNERFNGCRTAEAFEIVFVGVE